MNKEAQNMHR